MERAPAREEPVQRFLRAGAFFSGGDNMAEDKDFLEMCRKYAEARSEGTLRGKELSDFYQAIMEKGKSLDMTRYAMEEAIEKCLEERMI